MAIGWLAMLQTVPWQDVISAAPKVAGGARSLWQAVSNRSAGKPPQVLDAGADAVATAIKQHEESIASLNSQMLSASELITTLADQNASLVSNIARIRTQLMWSLIIAGTSLSIAVGSLVLVLK
ncbi:hypothetical protein [Duganella sp. BuS-21]|uniref:hypothetical protein n=1 Tax=Duganella sp. BuS-21 TaxID=2943848 RepID=UPI0035A6C201